MAQASIFHQEEDMYLVATRKLDDAAAKGKPVARYDHSEIEIRCAWQTPKSRKRGRGSPPLICRRRLKEMQRLFFRRFGGQRLPYDETGLDYLEIVAHHIAHLGGDAFQNILDWAFTWMPQISLAQAEALAEEVLAAAEPEKFKAGRLGWRLKLTDMERARLAITTIRAIDMSSADMKERRKRKDRERKARKRQQERASRPPKAEPLYRTRPWEALGMSQATWYRKGKPMPAGPTDDREKNLRPQQEAWFLTAADALFSHPPSLAARAFSPVTRKAESNPESTSTPSQMAVDVGKRPQTS
jgi:hypothetical protein